MQTLIWAHRGASGYAPENTMKAFKLAHRQGADGIELDIHLTKDKQIVVAHDETIDRCSNGTGRIVDMTLKELHKYDFSNNTPGYKCCKIPILEEVLSFALKTKMTVNIEIKSDVVIYQGIEEKALALVAKSGMKDKVIYSSFNHYSLMLLRQLDSTAAIGLLYNEALIDPHIYALHLKANAIHPYYKTLMVPRTVQQCKKNGILINPWTVNTPEAMVWMYKEGVNAIITDYPDIAAKHRQLLQK